MRRSIANALARFYLRLRISGERLPCFVILDLIRSLGMISRRHNLFERAWRGARFACLLAFAVAARGQESSSVPVLSRGDVELSGFGGFNVGQSFTRVSTTAFRAGLSPLNIVTPSSNGSIGGAGRVSISKRFLVDAEISYVGGGHLIFNQDYVLNQTPLIEQRVSVDAHSSAVLATGGGRYLFPTSRRSHLVPFVGGGEGR